MLIRSIGGDFNLVPLLNPEGEDKQDALGVDRCGFICEVCDGDFRLILARGLYKLRRGPGMKLHGMVNGDADFLH